jgi:plasmid stabilization system protein ParE
MTLKLVVEPSVEADIAAARVWLQERSPTAAIRFARAVRNSLLLIAQNPHQYQVVFGRYRRAMVRPFPYGLIYTVTKTEIIVIACMHGRRDPGTWQDRIRE